MIKTLFLRILEIVKFISLYWVGIFFPLFYCLSVISTKYWGDDNAFEQVIEAVNKYETGESVDISKGSGAEPHDLKKYVPDKR